MVASIGSGLPVSLRHRFKPVVSPGGVWKHTEALKCGCIMEDHSLAEVRLHTYTTLFADRKSVLQIEEGTESTAGISSPRSRAASSSADSKFLMSQVRFHVTVFSSASDHNWMNGAEEVLKYFQERTPGSYIDRTE